VLRLCVLGALNNQSANATATVDQEEASSDLAVDETAALSQVADIVALFRRSMTGWLVVIALLVLTS